MIFLTAGHTGPNTGAQGVATNQHCKIDEGAETIRLRNAIAHTLTAHYGIPVLIDNDHEHLAVICRQIKNLAQSTDIISIDIHLNAATSPSPNGTEVIIADNASQREIAIAVKLLNATSKALGTNCRGIKVESQTPARKLAMLHNHCTSVILEICFCSNEQDSAKYHKHFNRLTNQLAATIAQIATQQ